MIVAIWISQIYLLKFFHFEYFYTPNYFGFFACAFCSSNNEIGWTLDTFWDPHGIGVIPNSFCNWYLKTAYDEDKGSRLLDRHRVMLINSDRIRTRKKLFYVHHSRLLQCITSLLFHHLQIQLLVLNNSRIVKKIIKDVGVLIFYVCFACCFCYYGDENLHSQPLSIILPIYFHLPFK